MMTSEMNLLTSRDKSDAHQSYGWKCTLQMSGLELQGFENTKALFEFCEFTPRYPKANKMKTRQVFHTHKSNWGELKFGNGAQRAEESQEWER
eukprot:2082286-Amphidinium_carterae.1